MSDPTNEAVELFNRARYARAQGDLETAETLSAQAIEMFQCAEGENSPDAANLLNALAYIRQKRGDYDGAVQAAEQSVHILGVLGAAFLGNDAALGRLEAWTRLGAHAQQSRGSIARGLARHRSTGPFCLCAGCPGAETGMFILLCSSLLMHACLELIQPRARDWADKGANAFGWHEGNLIALWGA